MKRRHPVDAKPAVSLYERLEREPAQRSDGAEAADAAPNQDERTGGDATAAEQRDDGFGRQLDGEEGEP
jgi:hypothetical protein